jgi:hypothetical protein
MSRQCEKITFVVKLSAAMIIGALMCPPAAGDPRCAKCHAAESRRQPETRMAHALVRADRCQILHDNPNLSLQSGNYSYSIARVGGQSIYTVTDGQSLLSIALAWAFGAGKVGQTYVYQYKDAWYESRVSFYPEVQSLDLTTGAARAPETIEQAAGRRISKANECFSCHASEAVNAGKLTVSSLTPGVQCERCHGSAEVHLKAASGEARKTAPMRVLGGMNAEGMSEFCGQCHGTWSQIVANGPRGVFNVRFQPYRLANSKCYDAEDSRIRCTACHDPHQDAEKATAAYDSKCLACHSRTQPAAGARLCKVGKTECVTCHMPKIELPGAHSKFTDHRIRIARAGEAYPD